LFNKFEITCAMRIESASSRISSAAIFIVR
jgi:hypothetical protein